MNFHLNIKKKCDKIANDENLPVAVFLVQEEKRFLFVLDMNIMQIL